MGIIKHSLTLVVLATAVASVPEANAQGGTGSFKWYVGGQGGITSFRTAAGREVFAVGGGHFLITGNRVGLLLSVDQGFGSDQSTMTQFEIRDSVDQVVSLGNETWSFDGMRRYSAILLAYPIRNRNVQPYVGLGLGISHTTGNSQGPFADRHVENDLSSTGFATAVAGLEFRVGPLSAFGQYQVTTSQGFDQVETVLQRNKNGDAVFTRNDYGEWTLGANHTVVGGIRFSLGAAREKPKTGGY